MSIKATDNRWARAEELFHAALEQPEPQRPAAVARWCEGDEPLRREVMSLLELSTRATDFLDVPAVNLAGVDPQSLAAESEAAPDPLIGTAIAGFEILSRLGAGGMGVVYLARQESPERDVALKVVRAGLLSPSVLRRFEFEARTLGRLQHPGIAQIYHAGRVRTGTGVQPYFAMEYIRGEPLLEFAGARKLGVRDRLSLMAMICDAVDHAHAKGVIHRDLKPGNILVVPGDAARPGAWQPKILDFGVARAADPEFANTTMSTTAGEIVGTLAYMSPEQVSGDGRDMDTRSDVYSLGVVLYELLAGRVPVAVSGLAIPEALRAITERDPVLLGEIDRSLRGDIETIAAKALEKDRSRRYDSAAAMAADIRRCLADAPILARPATTFYQIRKFAKRNKALVAGALVAVLALIAGTVGTSVGMVRAWDAEADAVEAAGKAQASELVAIEALGAAQKSEERAVGEAARAIRAATKAERSIDFLQDSIAAARADNARGKEPTVREMVDAAAKRLSRESTRDKGVDAALHDVLGRTYASLALYDKAEPHLRQILDYDIAEWGESDPIVARDLLELSNMERARRNYKSAEDLARRCLAIQRKALGQEHEKIIPALLSLGIVLRLEGRTDEAEKILSEAQEMLGRVAPTQFSLAAQIRGEIGQILADRGDLKGSLGELRKSYLWHTVTLGEDSPSTIRALSQLVDLEMELEELTEAQKHLDKLMKLRQKVYGEESYPVMSTRSKQAEMLVRRKDYTRAREMLEQLLAWYRANMPDSAELAGVLNSMAITIQRTGKPAQAEEYFKEALSIREAKLGPEHRLIAQSLANMAINQIRQGRLPAAAPLLDRAVDIRRKLNDRSPQLATALFWQGKVRFSLGDAKSGLPPLREAYDFEAARSRVSSNFANTCDEYGRCLVATGDPAAADRVYREGLEAVKTCAKPGDTVTIALRRDLGTLLLNAGRHADAAETLKPAVEAEPVADARNEWAEAKALLARCTPPSP